MAPLPHDLQPPDPAAEARLDAALGAARPLTPALRERLLGLHAPLATPPVHAPPVAGRIGFRRARLAAAAGLAAAATLGVGGFLLHGPTEGPAPVATGPAAPAQAPDPLLLALDAAAAAVDPGGSFPGADAPGSAASRLAELEATAGDPWARSAWAAAESDALFAEGTSPPTSLF